MKRIPCLIGAAAIALTPLVQAQHTPVKELAKRENFVNTSLTFGGYGNLETQKYYHGLPEEEQLPHPGASEEHYSGVGAQGSLQVEFSQGLLRSSVEVEGAYGVRDAGTVQRSKMQLGGEANLGLQLRTAEWRIEAGINGRTAFEQEIHNASNAGAIRTNSWGPYIAAGNDDVLVKFGLENVVKTYSHPTVPDLSITYINTKPKPGVFGEVSYFVTPTTRIDGEFRHAQLTTNSPFVPHNYEIGTSGSMTISQFIGKNLSVVVNGGLEQTGNGVARETNLIGGLGLRLGR